MSKFKLNSEFDGNSKKNFNSKKHSSKMKRDREDLSDFAYMSRGNAKNELRYLKEMYGI